MNNSGAMLLRTYIDDSADQTHEKAVVAGAYVGFYHQRNELQKRWRRRLAQDGLKYFRTTEYYSLHGEFYRFRDPLKYPKPKGSNAAKALLLDLEEIIHTSQVMGIAVCVDMRAFRDIRESEEHAAEIFHSDAFEVALQALVGLVAEIVRDEWTGRREVAFVCDEASSAERISRLYVDYVDYKNSNPSLAEYLAGLTHQDDKRVRPLQAADMMAHLAKERFVDWLDDPEKKTFSDDVNFRERLKKLSVHKIAVWDRNYMMAVLKHEIQRRGQFASA